MNPELQLRDIHLPPEPSWWPPAPGWWLLAIVIGLVAWRLTRYGLRSWRARQRSRALQEQFDAVLLVTEPAAQLTAISELLRRAARQSDRPQPLWWAVPGSNSSTDQRMRRLRHSVGVPGACCSMGLTAPIWTSAASAL